MRKALERWLPRGTFEGIDRALARFLVGEGGGAVREEGRLQALLVALLGRSLREGHTCLDLTKLPGTSPYEFDASEPEVPSEDAGWVFPALEELRGALASADFVEVRSLGAARVSGGALSRGQSLPEERAAQESVRSGLFGETPPLVLEGERLYFRRYFEHEERLVDALVARQGARAELSPEELTALERYFPGAPSEEGQKLAARRALEEPFLIVSGGPGTGKTSTVVKILALFEEQAAARGAPPPEVLLLAPTGKAAARLVESIRRAKLEVPAAPEILARITEKSSTIHRALGVRPDSRTRFRRTPDSPLDADWVIVDEASMIDLALMRHLIEALAPTTRLLLLGDRHQLASVEAGSVLGELSEALGEGASLVELTKSYRFSPDSGIFRLAEAVRGGDVERALELLRAGAEDLEFLEEEGPLFESQRIRRIVVEGYRDALSQRDVRAALRAFEGFRVLAAHRRGPFGIESWNERARLWLVRAGLLPSGGEFYRGCPVLVTENDVALGLSNGDVGLVWPDERGELGVYFEGAEGAPRRFSPAQLPAHETAFAMTIHKTQGSEYGEVLVVLPEPESPLLSRELLYTAVTRARRRVLVAGQATSVERAASHRVERSSGLGGRLRSSGFVEASRLRRAP